MSADDAEHALAGLAREVVAQVIAGAALLEQDDTLALAWVHPFWRRSATGRMEEVRGHDISEPDWLKGQAEWKARGAAIWDEDAQKWRPATGSRGLSDTSPAGHAPAGSPASAAVSRPPGLTPPAAPEPKTGPAAVHPALGNLSRRPGDTLSGHAYRHLPQPLYFQPTEPELPGYQLPDHPGPLTSDEVGDRIEHVQQLVSQAMFDRLGTGYTQTEPGSTPDHPIWLPERADQHNQIVSALLARAAKVPAEGRAVVSGGVPGAGKSTVLRQLPGDWLHVDADVIKEEMAARGMVPRVGDLSPLEAAPLVHEESRHVAGLLASRAMAGHRNLAVDLTMAGEGTPTRYLEQLRAAGYPEVRALYVRADPETAVDRSQARYQAGMEAWRQGRGLGGRYMPAHIIRSDALASEQTFNTIRNRFDSSELWSTEGASPVRVSDYRPLGDQEYDAHTQRVEAGLAQAMSQGKATDQSQTLDPQGQIWRPERAVLHNEIVHGYVDRAVGVPSEHQAIIAGGLGGAGKSTVLGKYANVRAQDYVTLNPDDVKEEMAARGMIPHVEGLSPMEASPLVHEEASHITSLIARQMYQRGKNVIWDVTMSRPESVDKRIRDLEAHGYHDIGGVFVHIPVETSVDRALGRHRRGMEKFRQGEGFGGRYVPPSLIRSAERPGGTTVNRQAFEQLKPQFGWTESYDNTGNAPRLTGRTGERPEPVLGVERAARGQEQGTIGTPAPGAPGSTGAGPYTGQTERAARSAEEGTGL